MQTIPDILILRGRSARKSIHRIKSRAFRTIAVTLSIVLLTGGPAHAGPVTPSDVIQVIGTYQNPPDLRVRSLTQTTVSPTSGVKGAKVNSSGPQSSGESLLAGVSVSPKLPQRGVEIIDQGDVEGTICDCGEISILGGGFPKWPLLFLAAVPLFFIDGGGNFETPIFTPTPPSTVPTPTQNQTPVPVPEPATLLLFGSGLTAFAAGLRRRNAKAKLAQLETSEER